MGRSIPEIAGVRAVAAGSVLLYHLLYSYGLFGGDDPGQGNFFSLGWTGVDIFFVLSGFLLALPFLAHPASLRSSHTWKTYLLKRWLRIAPPYYASILVAILALSTMDYVWRRPDDIVLHLLYLHTFTPETIISIVSVYWTLGIEFQFYLVLPLLALLFLHRRWPFALLGLVGFSVIWRAVTWFPEENGSFWSFSLFGFLGHFALGLAAARLYLDGRRSPLPAGVVVPAALAFLVALPLWLADSWGGFSQADHSRGANAVVRPLLALGFAISLHAVTTRTGIISRLLSVRPMQWLGNASYSLYLIHLPVIFALKGAFVGWGFWPYLGASVAATLVATWLFYGLVERPSLALKDWVVSGRRTARRAPVGAPARPALPTARPTLAQAPRAGAAE